MIDTGSSVWINVFQIKRLLKYLKEDKAEVKAFKKLAHNKIEEHFREEYTDELTIAIHMLDPRNRRIYAHIVPSEFKVDILLKFKSYCFKQCSGDGNAEQKDDEHDVPTPNGGNDDDILFGIHDEVDNIPKASNVKDEIDQYIGIADEWLVSWSSNPADVDNALKWWSDQSIQNRYKTLAPLAMRLLCVPASSASVERLWSRARWTLKENKANLRPALFEDFLLLQTNCETFVNPDDDDSITKIFYS